MLEFLLNLFTFDTKAKAKMSLKGDKINRKLDKLNDNLVDQIIDYDSKISDIDDAIDELKELRSQMVARKAHYKGLKENLGTILPT